MSSDGIVPGRLVELSRDWSAELWPVRGGWNGPGSAPWAHRWIDGPAILLVLARVEDPIGLDDLLVATSTGQVGWTYTDSTRSSRLRRVER